jgi:hypothetical protein
MLSTCLFIPHPHVEETTYIDLGFIQLQIDNNTNVDEKRLCWESASSIFIPSTGNQAMNATIPTCFKIKFSDNSALIVAIEVSMNYIDQTFKVNTISKLFKHTWKQLFVNKKKNYLSSKAKSKSKSGLTNPLSKEYVQTSATKTYVFKTMATEKRITKKPRLSQV